MQVEQILKLFHLEAFFEFVSVNSTDAVQVSCTSQVIKFVFKYFKY